MLLFPYNGSHLEGLQVLKVIWIRYGAGLPLAPIVGVVNHRRPPLPLIVGVIYHWWLPISTPRNICTLRIVDQGCLPLTIHFIIPDRTMLPTYKSLYFYLTLKMCSCIFAPNKQYLTSIAWL